MNPMASFRVCGCSARSTSDMALFLKTLVLKPPTSSKYPWEHRHFIATSVSPAERQTEYSEAPMSEYGPMYLKFTWTSLQMSNSDLDSSPIASATPYSVTKRRAALS